MASATLPNVSADLVWEIVRNNNCYLAKSSRNGGVQFSRDPLNLTNKNSRKYAGFVNEKAIGVTPNEKGGVIVTAKKTSNANQPAKGFIRTTHGANNSNRKTYKAIARKAAASGYRGDLRSAAVERASAILHSQRTPRADHEVKLRGNKAKKAAELS